MKPLFIRFCFDWNNPERDFYELVEQRADGSYKSIIAYNDKQDVLDFASKHFPNQEVGLV